MPASRLWTSFVVCFTFPTSTLRTLPATPTIPVEAKLSLNKRWEANGMRSRTSQTHNAHFSALRSVPIPPRPWRSNEHITIIALLASSTGSTPTAPCFPGIEIRRVYRR
ncbi:camk camkl kin1 protein kinase [Moniliophthora roreri]|nr:camk camkl kin1 protein kinase [Moniliophthora roreri]